MTCEPPIGSGRPTSTTQSRPLIRHEILWISREHGGRPVVASAHLRRRASSRASSWDPGTTPGMKKDSVPAGSELVTIATV
jgi:hypothetical protein